MQENEQGMDREGKIDETEENEQHNGNEWKNERKKERRKNKKRNE